jgi:hypothetical protein
VLAVELRDVSGELSVPARLSRRLAFTFALALPALALARRASARHETLLRKHIVGYQGWFACPGDPDGDDWVHWFARAPDGRLLPTFDMLPDTAEFEPGEGCPTPWTGRLVRLFGPQGIEGEVVSLAGDAVTANDRDIGGPNGFGAECVRVADGPRAEG